MMTQFEKKIKCESVAVDKAQVSILYFWQFVSMLDSQFYSNFFTIDGYAIVRLLHLDLQNSGGFLQEEFEIYSPKNKDSTVSTV